jgi:hypothetical protein
MNLKIVALLAAFSLLPSIGAAAQEQDAKECPMMLHHDGVNERGDAVMGFSHEKTTHHFALYKDGGAIEVDANAANDTASRDLIRNHLSHIAEMFAAGDFDAPMLIHGRTPPGVSVLERLKATVAYEYHDTDRGGRIRITTQNREALQAVHDFLSFQITDHETGDSQAIVDAER